MGNIQNYKIKIEIVNKFFKLQKKLKIKIK